MDNRYGEARNQVEFGDPISSSFNRVGMSSNKLYGERASALNPNKYKKVKSKVGQNHKVLNKVEHGKKLAYYGYGQNSRSQSYIDILRNDIVSRFNSRSSKFSFAASNPRFVETKNQYVVNKTPPQIEISSPSPERLEVEEQNIPNGENTVNISNQYVHQTIQVNPEEGAQLSKTTVTVAPTFPRSKSTFNRNSVELSAIHRQRTANGPRKARPAQKSGYLQMTQSRAGKVVSESPARAQSAVIWSKLSYYNENVQRTAKNANKVVKPVSRSSSNLRVRSPAPEPQVEVVEAHEPDVVQVSLNEQSYVMPSKKYKTKKQTPVLLAQDNETFKLAQQAISQISKPAISELKALMNPPQMVKEICSCVMLLLGCDQDWLTAKKQMADAEKFITILKKYDVNQVTKKQLKKLKEWTKYPEFTPEFAKQKNKACSALLRWVLCVEAISSIRFGGRIEMVNGVISKNVYVKKPLSTLEPPTAEIPIQIQEEIKRGSRSPGQNVVLSQTLSNDRKKMNDESAQMESAVDLLHQELMKVREKRDDTFYNEHVNNEYKWKDYVDFKDKNVTKTAKLMSRKSQNLKEQRATVAQYGDRMNDAQRNMLMANSVVPGQRVAGRGQDVEVVDVNMNLAKRNQLAAYEQVFNQQMSRQQHIQDKIGGYLQSAMMEKVANK